MALNDSTLTDRTNAYVPLAHLQLPFALTQLWCGRRLLNTFSSRKFKAHELKEAVPLRSAHSYNSQHTENFTKFTQDATSLTGLTGQSDSNLVMDPEDKERTAEDLKGYKVRLPFNAVHQQRTDADTRDATLLVFVSIRRTLSPRSSSPTWSPTLSCSLWPTSPTRTAHGSSHSSRMTNSVRFDLRLSCAYVQG